MLVPPLLERFKAPPERLELRLWEESEDLHRDILTSISR